MIVAAIHWKNSPILSELKAQVWGRRNLCIVRKLLPYGWNNQVANKFGRLG